MSDIHDTYSLFLSDEEATLALGLAFGQCLEPGLVVHLHGDLGAGKTTFVRGVLRGCGYAGRVKSPTYTLVEPYELFKLYLYHLDLYRFEDPREWLDSGLGECFGPDKVGLVEWPEKAAGMVPGADLALWLEFDAEGRRASLRARTERGKRCLDCLTEIRETPTA